MKLNNIFSNTFHISRFYLLAILIASIATLGISISFDYTKSAYAEEMSTNSKTTNSTSYSAIPNLVTNQTVLITSSLLAPNGTFNNPFGIVVDRLGNIDVVDRGNNRIQTFDSSGNFKGQFGTFGSDPDGLGPQRAPPNTFSNPTGIALDSAGNIYAADSGNNRIEVFNATGTFRGQFGNPNPQQANGTFHVPVGITIDPSGQIFVVDSQNSRVQKFSHGGAFNSTFGTFGADPDGGGPLQATNGTFNSPTGIALDSAGNIYVIDSGNARVEAFDSQGVFKSKFGSYGADPDGPGPLQAPDGTFNSPTGIAVNGSGYMYITDSGNNRVEIFDSQGVFKSKFGSYGADPDGEGPLQAPDGTFNGPTGIAIDSVGNIYVSDSQHYRIQKFDSNGDFMLKFGTFGANPNDPIPLPPAAGIALDSAGNIYAANSSNNHINVFNSSGVFKTRFGNPGPQQVNGTLNVPVWTAVNGSGYIYVTDSQYSRVQIFGPGGVPTKLKFGTFGADPDGGGPLQAPDGTFNSPTGIALDSAGNIYVIDSGNARVEAFDSQGVFKSKFGSYGADPDGPGPLQASDGTFNKPFGIVVNGSGYMYVTDSGNNRVEIFDSQGVFKSKFGSYGADPDGPGPLRAPDGTFNNPKGIALDSAGNIYVADSGNNRVEIFDSQGVFKSKFGIFALFNRPTGITDDISGNIYILDLGNTRIQKFDSTGKLIFETITLHANGTGTVLFPSGTFMREKLPSNSNGTLTFKNIIASTNTGNLTTAFKFLQTASISTTNGASCSLGCVLSFIVTQAQLNAGGFVSQKLVLFHDLNNDNDFNDTGEQLNATVTQKPKIIFTLATTTTENSNSSFAIGMVSNIYSATLNDTVGMSDSVSANSTSGMHLFLESLNDTVGMSDSVSANSTSGMHLFLESLNDTVGMSDNVAIKLSSTTTNFTIPIRHSGDWYHSPPVLDGISFSTTQNLNGKEVEFGGRLASANSTSIFETGRSVELKLLLEEAQGAETISHVALYANLPARSSGIQDSDTHIIYDKFDGNEILDPNGFFSNVNFTTSKIDASHLQVTFDITFAKEMKKSDIIVRVWTVTRDNYDARIPNALAVVSPNILQKDDLGVISPKILQPSEMTTQTQSVPQWIKNSANGWALGHEKDSDFANVLQYLINNDRINSQQFKSESTSIKIPYWVKGTANLWMQGQISDDEFISGIQWLISNGSITLPSLN